MRRRAAKIDANQPAIVKGLREIPGVTVRSLAAVGDGMFDLIVGYRQRNFLLEVKDPEASKQRRDFTPEQKQFAETWTGQCTKIFTLDEALVVIGFKQYASRPALPEEGTWVA